MNSLRGISGRTLTYDDEDHLLTVGDASYQYDLDGYLTTKTIGTEPPYEVTTYSYLSRGELLRVLLPEGTLVEYVHDPLGRRIAKKVNGDITEKYLWQGLTRLLAVYDGADNLLMRFLYADDRMPAAMEQGGSTYYLTYDQVGSLRVVADGSGNVVKRIDYDSFGNIIDDTNLSFEVSIGFAGGLSDRDTGLVRFGFRDYDPDTGRWTAKDPIGLTGGNTDLYGYCLNDPTNLVDPAGLLNILLGGGCSAVAPTGTEGSAGVVINPGLGTDEADVGVFGSLGAGGGVNVSADAFIGFIKGDTSNVSGVTGNINIVAGPLSITTITNPKTVDVVGFTVGVGPSATPIGASGTLSATGTFTLRDLIKLLKRSTKQLEPVPCD